MTDAPFTLTTDSAGDAGTTERRLPWAAAPLTIILSAVGVLALVIGLVTPWVDVTVDRVAGAEELQAAIDVAIESEYGSPNPVGLTLDDGALVIVLSIAFAGLLALHLKRGRRGKGLPIAAFVVAGLLATIGFGNIADIGETNDQLQLLLPVSISVAFGLYLTCLGGVLAMTGASVAIAKAEAKQQKSVA